MADKSSDLKRAARNKRYYIKQQADPERRIVRTSKKSEAQRIRRAKQREHAQQRQTQQQPPDSPRWRSNVMVTLNRPCPNGAPWRSQGGARSFKTTRQRAVNSINGNVTPAQILHSMDRLVDHRRMNDQQNHEFSIAAVTTYGQLASFAGGFGGFGVAPAAPSASEFGAFGAASAAGQGLAGSAPPSANAFGAAPAAAHQGPAGFGGAHAAAPAPASSTRFGFVFGAPGSNPAPAGTPFKHNTAANNGFVFGASSNGPTPAGNPFQQTSRGGYTNAGQARSGFGASTSRATSFSAGDQENQAPFSFDGKPKFG